MPKLPTEKPIRSVAFVSLGCAKNLVDSERMLGLLAQDGITITPDATAADAIVINTCGFLEASKEESLREINEAVALKRDGKCRRVVVAGCLVQRHKTKLLNDVPEHRSPWSACSTVSTSSKPSAVRRIPRAGARPLPRQISRPLDASWECRVGSRASRKRRSRS